MSDDKLKKIDEETRRQGTLDDVDDRTVDVAAQRSEVREELDEQLDDQATRPAEHRE